MSQAVHRSWLLAIFGLCVLAVPVLSVAQETNAPYWSYIVDSRIDIKNAQKADLPTLKFDCNAVHPSIIDNGHTVVVNYAPGSTLTVGGAVYQLA